jgi:hypothetical protein
MDALNHDDLRNLLDTTGKWCVSIYMPTVRVGAEVQQNPIRYKNMLRQAEDQLARLEMRKPDIDRLLRPAYALLDDPEVWRNASDGMAIFAHPDRTTYYRLPFHFEELVVAKDRFYIKPLLPLLSDDGRFYVLALSQNQVRLLEGTRQSVAEIPLEGVPESLAEALWPDDPERQLQSRVLGRGAGAQSGASGAIFHGHGVGSDAEAKQDLLRYFHKLDHGLNNLLADKQILLVLAGVDYLLPIYREANTYPHLAEKGITGNPETLSARELHDRAWAIVGPEFAQAREEEAERYRALAGRDDEQADGSLVEIVRAAHQGRVATLFVPLGVRKWGVFRSHSYKVHVHPDMQPGDQDLIDLAAVQTVLNGGAVYAVDEDEVPGDGTVAAIYRY